MPHVFVEHFTSLYCDGDLLLVNSPHSSAESNPFATYSQFILSVSEASLTNTKQVVFFCHLL